MQCASRLGHAWASTAAISDTQSDGKIPAARSHHRQSHAKHGQKELQMLMLEGARINHRPVVCLQELDTALGARAIRGLIGKRHATYRYGADNIQEHVTARHEASIRIVTANIFLSCFLADGCSPYTECITRADQRYSLWSQDLSRRRLLPTGIRIPSCSV